MKLACITTGIGALQFIRWQVRLCLTLFSLAQLSDAAQSIFIVKIVLFSATLA